jgi:hypothetical protein
MRLVNYEDMKKKEEEIQALALERDSLVEKAHILAEYVESAKVKIPTKVVTSTTPISTKENKGSVDWGQVEKDLENV